MIRTDAYSSLRLRRFTQQALYHTNPPIPSKKKKMKKTSKGVRRAADTSVKAQQSGEVMYLHGPAVEGRANPQPPGEAQEGAVVVSTRGGRQRPEGDRHDRHTQSAAQALRIRGRRRRLGVGRHNRNTQVAAHPLRVHGGEVVHVFQQLTPYPPRK